METNKKAIDMLGVLHRAEEELPELLKDPSTWSTLLIDYHPPMVERLWMPLYGGRIYLHIIHPCSPEEALFHAHPCPSAMKILEGTYEMPIGYGAGETAPPVAITVILAKGSEYEMTHPDGWHAVIPIGGKVVSLMVTGMPWGRVSPKSSYPLRPLSEERKIEVIEIFRSFYSEG